jgi:hypothetical protein
LPTLQAPLAHRLIGHDDPAFGQSLAIRPLLSECGQRQQGADGIRADAVVPQWPGKRWLAIDPVPADESQPSATRGAGIEGEPAVSQQIGHPDGPGGAAGALGGLGTYANIKVEYGTQATPSFPSCTGFNSAGTLYDGGLNGFATTYAGGYAATPGADGDWDQNETLVYRVTVSIDDDANAEGLSTGAHALRWEAQNQ